LPPAAAAFAALLAARRRTAPIEIRALLSDRRTAPVRKSPKAAAFQRWRCVRVISRSAAFDRAIRARRVRPALIVLAGYMRVIVPASSPGGSAA
jgi:folate-dependent phosphoribosylglycinamide formyltransferase PurN